MTKVGQGPWKLTLKMDSKVKVLTEFVDLIQWFLHVFLTLG